MKKKGLKHISVRSQYLGKLIHTTKSLKIKKIKIYLVFLPGSFINNIQYYFLPLRVSLREHGNLCNIQIIIHTFCVHK